MLPNHGCLSKSVIKGLLIVICVLLIAGSPGVGNAVAISAQTAALVDVESGRVLYTKNERQQMKIASLTKIMTAIVAIENADLNSIVKTSNKASGVEGSSIYLKVDEKMKLHDMLYGLMLRSGNDAATAIAEHVSGSMEDFVVKMNEKAVEIGMTNTKFTNPHGLDWGEGNYSTAADMGTLLAYCLRNPVFKEIVSTKVKKVPWDGEEYDRIFYNKNKMLNLYPGGDGVKTGYTVRAGRCLASSASRDNWQLATIVLNAPDWWRDSSNLLDYGFTTYKREPVLQINKPLQKVSVKKGKEDNIHVVATKEIFYPVTEEEKDQFSYEWKIPESVKAPIKKDQQIGNVVVSFQEEIIAIIPLYSDREVEKKSLFERFLGIFR